MANIFSAAAAAVTQALSDEETRSRILQVAANLAKNAALFGCEEGLKSIPGGIFAYKIVMLSIPSIKKFEGHDQREMEALEARVAKVEESIKKSRS